MKKDGVWVFNVRHSKTMAGVRVVPVHDRLGWVLEEAQTTGKERLFLEAIENPEGSGAYPTPSRHFTKLKEAQGLTRKGLKFHSLRKNFVFCSISNDNISKGAFLELRKECEVSSHMP